MLADGAASYCVHTDVITEHLARDLVPSGAIIRGTWDTSTVLKLCFISNEIVHIYHVTKTARVSSRTMRLTSVALHGCSL